MKFINNILPKDIKSYPPQLYIDEHDELVVLVDSVEQLRIFKNRYNYTTYHDRLSYNDFRDVWIYQDGCCKKCGLELDFWKSGSHHYRIVNNCLYCYKCSFKLK